MERPFKCDYARTSKAKCARCSMDIEQLQSRLAEKTEVTTFGAKPHVEKWHHVECFFDADYKIKSVSQLDGFSILRFNDQEYIKDRIMSKGARGRNTSQEGESPPKRKKHTQNVEHLRLQTDAFFELHDLLKKEVKPEQWILILEENNQAIPKKRKNMPENLLHVTDVIYFGALPLCNECENGKYVLQNVKYECNGQDCIHTLKTPNRQRVIIPELLLEQHSFLRNYVQEQRTRFFDPDDEAETQPADSQAIAELMENNSASNSFIVKQQLRFGNVIDSEFEHMNQSRVFSDKDFTYCSYLIKVDIKKRQNSRYKLILLESDERDKNKSYWVFTKWGAIGRKDIKMEGIPNYKSLQFPNLEEAKSEYFAKFKEKTGNEFGKDFQKQDGKYSLAKIDYGRKLRLANDSVESKLKQPVQDLVELLFDEQTLIDYMILEFDLDISQLPLGKLKEDQLNDGTEVLKSIAKMLNEKSPRHELVKKSNEFYTLIPHFYDKNQSPIIETQQMVKKKIELINCLKNIEITFKLLNKINEMEIHPIDFHYSHLNTEIEVLNHESEEYKLLAEYIETDHIEIHKFTLEVKEIFKITRADDKNRAKSLNKSKLLFHGTRVLNVVSMLLNSLEIDKPGVSKTGSMYGPGIYFSDMMCKSAEYCHAKLSDNTGLVLLCQVALGEVKKLYKDDENFKLPKGFDSVKAIGKRLPDPGQSKEFDGIEIPSSTTININKVDSSIVMDNLLIVEPEYVIQDTSRVIIKYIAKLEFSYEQE